MRLKVSKKPDGSPEIFYSIQGEGINTGRPAVFLRLALCNLKCAWCDTKYTWDWQSHDPKEQIILLSSQDIEKEILKHDCRYQDRLETGRLRGVQPPPVSLRGAKPRSNPYPRSVKADGLLRLRLAMTEKSRQGEGDKGDKVAERPRYLVVTGGEPMLQQKALLPLLKHLKAGGFFVEIETNGTILPDAGMLSAVGHWSVSPKLANSGNPLSTREIARCYSMFARLPSCHFKYVIQNKRDFAEVRRLMRKYKIAHQQIVLMPQGQNVDELIRRSVWLVELCKAEGCLFSTRLQVLLWGNERGV